METLLSKQQKDLFLKFSQTKPSIEENIEHVRKKKEDKDFAFFNERNLSNLSKLILLNESEFEILKSFLTLPIGIIISDYHYLRELRYCNIKTVGDIFETDWVYFPKTYIRRPMLKLLENIIGCELNFVLLFTAEQKIELE